MTASEIQKTNAMRALDQRKLPYEVRVYPEDIRSADAVAAVLGVPPALVYKTLVMVRDGSTRPILVMVPGDREVDQRILARELGYKSIHMASKLQAEQMTGLQTGGIGALALLNKRFEVYIDRSALLQESIFVNGGRRGLNLHVKTPDLIAVTGARPVATGRPG